MIAHLDQFIKNQWIKEHSNHLGLEQKPYEEVEKLLEHTMPIEKDLTFKNWEHLQ